MKKIGLTLLLVSAALVSSLPASLASGLLHKHNLPPCEPGYQWVQVTEIQEVCREVCKIVPDVKKTTKWVYSTVDDPFCLHRSGAHGHGHHGNCEPGCPSCEGPFCRKQLVKRAVICEEPTTKCVVEKIVEHVPCTVWKKVACAPQPDACPPAATPSPK
jgi:hypothetical protein